MRLPLNIPYLLSRIRPNARYVMNGRSYGDIVWLDEKERVPTLLELENEFHRIQALEREHKNKTELLNEEANKSAHEKLEKAKAEAKDYATETARLVDNEISKLNIEMQALRAKALERAKEERVKAFKDLELLVAAERESLTQELALAHNKLLEEAVETIQKTLVFNKERKAIYPSKDEMAKAIRGGRKSIEDLAKKMREGKLRK